MSIKMCIGIHNNNCTEVALYHSLLCEACEREYKKTCKSAQDAAERAKGGEDDHE